MLLYHTNLKVGICGKERKDGPGGQEDEVVDDVDCMDKVDGPRKRA